MMSNFDLQAKELDAAVFETFGEKAIYNGACLIDVVVNEAVPYSDEDGQVFSTIDEMEVIEQAGLTISSGDTIETDEKTYKVQRFLRQSGKVKVYEIA